MMRPALKPCPFCSLSLMMVGVGTAQHPAGGCILSGAVVYATRFADWNRRAVMPEAMEGGAV